MKRVGQLTMGHLPCPAMGDLRGRELAEGNASAVPAVRQGAAQTEELSRSANRLGTVKSLLVPQSVDVNWPPKHPENFPREAPTRPVSVIKCAQDPLESPKARQHPWNRRCSIQWSGGGSIGRF